MTIAVVGAGAIGLSLAALLWRAKRDVAIVARRRQLATLANGVEIRGVAGDFRVAPRVSASVPEDADVVVFTVKTQDLPSALPLVTAFPHATVVAAQNGLAADALVEKAVGAERAVGCVTVYDAVQTGPAEVEIGRVGELLLGGPRSASVAAALAPAILTRTTANLVGARWLKLILNVNNALCAATGLSLQELYEDPAMVRLSLRALKEGARVARAEGVRLEGNAWASPATVRLLTMLPEPLAVRALSRKARRVFRGKPILGSTLQSLRQGKSTEVDFLNGEIVARGERRGVATPVNARLVRCVHEIEKGRAFYRPDELR